MPSAAICCRHAVAAVLLVPLLLSWPCTLATQGRSSDIGGFVAFDVPRAAGNGVPRGVRNRRSLGLEGENYIAARGIRCWGSSTSGHRITLDCPKHDLSCYSHRCRRRCNDDSHCAVFSVHDGGGGCYLLKRGANCGTKAATNWLAGYPEKRLPESIDDQLNIREGADDVPSELFSSYLVNDPASCKQGCSLLAKLNRYNKLPCVRYGVSPEGMCNLYAGLKETRSSTQIPVLRTFTTDGEIMAADKSGKLVRSLDSDDMRKDLNDAVIDQAPNTSSEQKMTCGSDYTVMIGQHCTPVHILVLMGVVVALVAFTGCVTAFWMFKTYQFDKQLADDNNQDDEDDDDDEDDHDNDKHDDDDANHVTIDGDEPNGFVPS